MNIAEIFSIDNIASWFFYLSAFGSASILAHLSITRKRKLFAALAIIVPTIVGGLRYMVGIDYASYVEKIQLLADRDLINYITTSIKNVFEPTMFIMSHTTFATSKQAIGFLSITCGLTVLFYYLAARKYSTKHTGLMFFLILMTVFPKDLSGVRQGVAVAICFYAVSLITEKRLLRYIILVALAGMFHYSAFIMLTIYPLYWLLYKKWPLIKDKYYGLRVSSLVGAGFGAVVLLVKNLASIPFFGRYAYLLSPDKLATTGTPNILAKAAPVLLVLPFYPKLVQQDKNNAFYMLLSVMAVAMTAIGFFAGPIYRLANYFMPFYAILFINVIDTLETKRKQRIAILLIILYAIVHFTGSNLIRNSYGIFPYQFIF